MKKHYYLGLNARRRGGVRHLLIHGRKSDYTALSRALALKYGGTAVLTKNGRTGLFMALKVYVKRGSGVIITGFTCYAVYEAVRLAGCVPVYADIDKKTLNFTPETLENAIKRAGKLKISAIIIQNTLGNATDIEAVEAFAHKHQLIIIEDLAHSVGIRYKDGREAGTVGAAAVLSFGKDKSIDTISGGAVVFRDAANNRRVKGAPSKIPRDTRKEADFAQILTDITPKKRPKCSDYLRERLYPMLAAWVRGLTHVHLGGFLMRILLKTRLVQKSADNRLDFARRMPYFEARLALEQVRAMGDAPQEALREFYLVRDRGEVLEKLKQAGYHFAGFWYEKPISPERYYHLTGYDEATCPVATEVAKQIINFPKYYTETELAPARKIIQPYLVKSEDTHEK